MAYKLLQSIYTLTLGRWTSRELQQRMSWPSKVHRSYDQLCNISQWQLWSALQSFPYLLLQNCVIFSNVPQNSHENPLGKNNHRACIRNWWSFGFIRGSVNHNIDRNFRILFSVLDSFSLGSKARRNCDSSIRMISWYDVDSLSCLLYYSNTSWQDAYGWDFFPLNYFFYCKLYNGCP